MNSAKMKNEDLYELCLMGYEPAWGYVTNYVFCIVRTGNWRLPDSLEDTTQSIVCHLLTKGIDRVNTPKAFRGYVKRVAVNFILDKLKVSRMVFTSIDEQDDEAGPAKEVADSNPGPQEAALLAGLVDAIERNINKLPEKCRDVVQAYIDYKCGQYDNYKQLAEVFGKSIGSLSSKINRCLDKLKDLAEIKIWLEK